MPELYPYLEPAGKIAADESANVFSKLSESGLLLLEITCFAFWVEFNSFLASLIKVVLSGTCFFYFYLC